MGRRPENFSANTNFGKYQDHRKAMKMGTSKKRLTSEIQVSVSTPPKISRHGGLRPGAGRKPGSGNKQSFAVEPIADALAKAVAGKPAFLFISAMQVLEAPLDDVREALGLSRDQFISEYGVYLRETAELRRRGEAYFADKNNSTRRAKAARWSYVSEPVTRSDTRQAAVERAVKAAALALLSRDQTVAEVVAALTAAVAGDVPADITPRESVAAVRQSRQEQMVVELVRLERQDRGRAAAMLVARKFAADARDPIEVASLARKLRRWRREKNGQCPVAAPETI
jgi:hypothetical protein